MPKSINVTDIPEDLYFRLLRWKYGEFRAKTWVEFFAKVNEALEEWRSFKCPECGYKHT